jgi:hypothetical protein
MAPTTANVPHRLLLTGAAPGSSLSSESALEALAAGLEQAGWPDADLCPLPGDAGARALDAVDFDVRMRAARAVVVVTPRLDEHTLAASVTFEIATRARQSGVPAYAVAGENRLDAFDARVLDLQLIVQARGARSLQAAGRRLGAVV